MNKTKLMERLFSKDLDFTNKFLKAFSEAEESGISELKDETGDIQLAKLDDETFIAEDQANDNEVTEFTKNPEDENDYMLRKVDIDETDETEDIDGEDETEDLKNVEDQEKSEESSQSEYSETLDDHSSPVLEGKDGDHLSKTVPDVNTSVLEGKDGNHITETIPEVEIDAHQGIVNEEKAGLKSFSIKLSGFKSAYQLTRVYSALSSVFSEIYSDEEVMSPNGITGIGTSGDEGPTSPEDSVDTSDDLSEESNDEGKEKFESDTEVPDEDSLNEIKDKANELVKKVEELEETKDPKLAEEVKSLSDELTNDLDEISDHDVDDVKELCDKAEKMYSSIKESQSRFSEVQIIKGEVEDLHKLLNPLGVEFKDDSESEETKESPHKSEEDDLMVSPNDDEPKKFSDGIFKEGSSQLNTMLTFEY